MHKDTILKTSLGAGALSTLIAIGVTIGATSPETVARSMAVAGFIGLFSITSFFVGLAFPKKESTTNHNNISRGA